MTMPTKAVVTTAGQHMVARAGEWTGREAALIQSALAPGLSTEHMRVFALICRHTGLDPAKRQIYAWIDKGRLCIHIGINGWRQMAVATGEYAGQVGPEWCGPDGVWRDVWLSDEPPAAARVGIMRRGFAQPIWHVSTWREFAREKLPIWQEKGAHMLAVRAEGHALQRSFPDVYAAAASMCAENRVTVSVGEDVGVVDAETGEIVAPVTEQPAGDFPAAGECAGEEAGADSSHPTEEPPPGAEPGAPVNWSAFWGEAKRLGFSQKQVHALVGVDSLAHLDAAAIAELLELLRANAAQREDERLL